MPQQQKIPKYRRGFKKWTDEKVLEIRKQLGLQEYSPVCAFELCQLYHIPIFTPCDFPDLPSKYRSELLGNGASYWSALTIRINGSSHIIIYNPTHSPERQQSDIMHELGHIICGHTLGDDDSGCFTGYLRNIDGEKEDEASWFGACMQLPRPALLYCLRKRMSIEDIAKEYNCSSDMARYRINKSGVNKQLLYTKNKVHVY